MPEQIRIDDLQPWYMPDETRMTRLEIDGVAPLPRNVGIFVFNQSFDYLARFLKASVEPVSASFLGTGLEFKVEPYADSIPKNLGGVLELPGAFFLRSLKKFPTDPKVISFFEKTVGLEMINPNIFYERFNHNWVRLFSGEKVLEDAKSSSILLEKDSKENITHYRDMFLLQQYDVEFTVGFNPDKKWFYKVSQNHEKYDSMFGVVIDNLQLYLQQFIGMHKVRHDKSERYNTNFILFEH